MSIFKYTAMISLPGIAKKLFGDKDAIPLPDESSTPELADANNQLGKMCQSVKEENEYH